MQGTIQAAEGHVRSAELPSAIDRIKELATEADEKRLGGNREIREALAGLVSIVEQRAMEQLATAQQEYFAGYHAESLATFEEIASLDGLRAAREAARELRKEDDRAEWRTLSDSATNLMDRAEFVDARPALAGLTRLARRTGYDTATDALVAQFSTAALAHVEQAVQAIEREDYESAYGVLLEVSRLSMLREPSIEARQLLRQHANTPAMRQAEREYESADALAQIRLDLSEADGRRNAEAVRQQAHSKLEQLVSRYEGTRAAAEAQRLANELNEQLAAG